MREFAHGLRKFAHGLRVNLFEHFAEIPPWPFKNDKNPPSCSLGRWLGLGLCQLAGVGVAVAAGLVCWLRFVGWAREAADLVLGLGIGVVGWVLGS